MAVKMPPHDALEAEDALVESFKGEQVALRTLYFSFCRRVAGSANQIFRDRTARKMTYTLTSYIQNSQPARYVEVTSSLFNENKCLTKLK